MIHKEKSQHFRLVHFGTPCPVTEMLPFLYCGIVGSGFLDVLLPMLLVCGVLTVEESETTPFTAA